MRDARPEPLSERPARRARPRDRHLGQRLAWSTALVQLGGTTTQPSGFTRNESWVVGLTSATAFAQAPDGRLFIAQQGGSLRVVKNGALLATPFATVAVDSAGERGLIGVALHPSFATNGWVYIYSTRSIGGVSHNRISRFTANGDVAAAGSEVVLVDLPNLSGATNHNGGGMHFGADGKLYVGVGENANGAQAQNLALPFGKLLRFNEDGSIPTDNPFFATQTGLGRAVWAYGLRNPFTFAVQPGTGRIHINDVGETTWEEIDVGTAGANYGWPGSEGPDNVGAGVTAPLFTYKHADAAPLGSGRAASSRDSRSPAARSTRPPARSPTATATSTTSPTSSAASSAASTRPTATLRMRSRASAASRSTCSSAATERSTS
jgi:glucose/arabinose dehydrogenase